MGLVPLYPMGVADILDTSFKMLRACAGPAVLLVLLLLGPVQVAASAGFQSPFTALSDPVPQAMSPQMLGLAVVGALLSLVLTPLVQTSLTWMGAHATAESSPTWRESLRHGARRYWATLGAFVLLGLAGLLVLAIPGVIFVLAFATENVGFAVLGVLVLLPALLVLLGLVMLSYLVLPCIVVERLGPVEGLRRAWRLLRARFWPTLGVAFVVGLVLTLLGGAVSSVVSIPGLLPFPGAWVFIALAGILDSLIRAPLGSFAALAIHVDQRIRTEGYDVAVLVSELRR